MEQLEHREDRIAEIMSLKTSTDTAKIILYSVEISDLTVSMLAVCRIVCGMCRAYCHHRNQPPVTSPVQGCLLLPRALLQPATSNQQP